MYLKPFMKRSMRVVIRAPGGDTASIRIDGGMKKAPAF
jgi:hypothetical protein